MKKTNNFKKVIYGTLFLGLIGLGAVGCKKEKVNVTQPVETYHAFENENPKLGKSNRLENPFEAEGKELFNFLKDLSNKIIDDEDKDEILFFIDNSNLNFFLNLGEGDLIPYKIFFEKEIINYSNIVDFEQNILADDDLNQNVELLRSISYFKWGYYFMENDPKLKVSGFFACWDRKVRQRLSTVFNDGNIIDQVQYVAGIPGSWLYTASASALDCL